MKRLAQLKLQRAPAWTCVPGIATLLPGRSAPAQQRGIINNGNSAHAVWRGVNLSDVRWADELVPRDDLLFRFHGSMLISLSSSQGYNQLLRLDQQSMPRCCVATTTWPTVLLPGK